MGTPKPGESDPFDEADDFFLSSLEFEEPPLKKQKVEGFDDDDDLFCNIADELEKSFEEQGNSGDDEFKTGIGRPHPLLLPEVLEIVMGYIEDGKVLSTCRLVSTAWYDAATVHWPKYNEIQNVSHVIERYPYGLSYSSKKKDFETEYKFPGIMNLKIADPCYTFTKPIVNDYFNSHGHVLKSFAFDANFWCIEHVSLLVSVVFKWCVNLEDLKLINTGNRTVLNYYSMYGSDYFKNKHIRLRNLSITATDNADMDHHHYSTYNRVDPRFDFLYSQGAMNDGGLLGKIVCAAENLKSIRITSNWTNPAGLLKRGVLPNLKLLEINGGTITKSDLSKMKGVSLSELKIGPIRDLTKEFKRLLKHEANSLESLELLGDGNCEQMSIKFPVMSLKKLVIHDALNIRIRSISFMTKLPNLKVLHLNSDSTKPNVTSTLKRLEHHGITTLQLTGKCCYATVNIHAWFPNIRVLNVTVLGDNSFKCLLKNVSMLKNLESLSIVFSACNRSQIAAYTREHVPKIKSLKQLTLSFLGFNNLVPFGIHDFNALVRDSNLTTILLVNYFVYDDEAEELANLLAEKLLSATFTSCRIQPRRIIKSNCSSVCLDNVLLCKFSLKPLVQHYFHVIQ